MSATDRDVLLAIHDELRAIRDHVTPTPKGAEPERPDTCCGKCPPVEGGGVDCTCEGNPRCTPGPEEDTCCDCHLEAEQERDRARRDAEALAEEVDGLQSERAVDLERIERLTQERDDALVQRDIARNQRDAWRGRWQAVIDTLGGEPR